MTCITLQLYNVSLSLSHSAKKSKLFLTAIILKFRVWGGRPLLSLFGFFLLAALKQQSKDCLAIIADARRVKTLASKKSHSSSVLTVLLLTFSSLRGHHNLEVLDLEALLPVPVPSANTDFIHLITMSTHHNENLKAKPRNRKKTKFKNRTTICCFVNFFF